MSLGKFMAGPIALLLHCCNHPEARKRYERSATLRQDDSPNFGLMQVDPGARTAHIFLAEPGDTALCRLESSG